MSNETKNRQHAIGTFVGAEPVAAPFTSRIVNAVGVDSFTRNSAGNYTAVLRDAIAFAGATVRADLPANFLGIVGAQLAPDGASVLVTVFDLSGAPADAPLVALEVVSVVQGEGDDGPKPALPPVPTPPSSGGQLLGFCQTNGAGNVISSPPGLVVSNPVPIAPVGIFQYTLAPGTQLAAVSVEQDISAGESGVSVLSATTCEVRTYNSAGAGSAQAHYAWFYRV